MARLPNSLSFRLVVTVDVRGEELIPDGFTGRVQLLADHGIVEVRWLDRGVLDDPAADVPAVTRFRPDGTVKQIRHYRNGRLHDPGAGQPAVRGYFVSGRLRYAEHYRYGWRQDHGEVPAIRKWRADGSLRSCRRYVDDQPIRPGGRRS